MKIAYILTDFPSLTETFASREIEGLRRWGADVEILAAGGDVRVEGCTYRPERWSWCAISSILYMLRAYPLAPLRYMGILARFLFSCPREALTLLGNLHTAAFFCRRLDDKQIRHVHAYFLSWPACVALAVAKISGRRFSIAAHARDIFVESGATAYKVKNALFVTVCSQQGLGHLKKLLPPCLHNKLRLVRHGVETSFTALPPKGCGTRQARVLAIGRLVPKKGFEFLVRAFGKVAARCPGAKLTIVGEGPEEGRLKELIRKLGLKDSTHLAGRRQHEEVMSMLAESAVLVVPSVVSEDGDRDGVPNVILEALACGVPVIASRLEGIEEAVQHNQTGLLVRPGDIDELAEATTLLLADEELRERLAAKAKEVVSECFDAETNTPKLAAIFEGWE